MKIQKQGAVAFRVRGKGAFPGVMLRRDACWPVEDSDVDAVFIDIEDTAAYLTPRTIQLASTREPNKERWASFGWEVLGA